MGSVASNSLASVDKDIKIPNKSEKMDTLFEEPDDDGDEEEVDDGKSTKTTGENEELIASESMEMAFSVLNDEDAKEFRKDENGIYTEAFQEAISDIDNAYNSESSGLRNKCGEFLSLNSYGALDRLCDVIVDLCESGYETSDGDIIYSNYLIFKDSLSIIWDFTGRNHGNQEEMVKICNYPLFLTCLTLKLKAIEVKSDVDDLDEVRISRYRHVLNIM